MAYPPSLVYAMQPGNPEGPIKHTTQPIVTGASVIAIKYAGGIIMGTDTLASYGSNARYKGVCRLKKVGAGTLLGASGEMSDFQQMSHLLEDIDTDDWMAEDGLRLGPKEIWNYMGRVLYNKRSKFNPLLNQFVVAGYQDGESFLGFVDHQGTCYQEKFIATGFGMHLAMPMLREAWKEGMTEAEARQLVAKCLEVLFYRDCYASNEVQIAKVDPSGVAIDAPVVLGTNWTFEHWNKSLVGASLASTSW